MVVVGRCFLRVHYRNAGVFDWERGYLSRRGGLVEKGWEKGVSNFFFKEGKGLIGTFGDPL